MNKSIPPRMEPTGIEYPTYKCKTKSRLEIKQKMLLVNICSVNV